MKSSYSSDIVFKEINYLSVSILLVKVRNTIANLACRRVPLCCFASRFLLNIVFLPLYCLFSHLIRSSSVEPINI